MPTCPKSPAACGGDLYLGLDYAQQYPSLIMAVTQEDVQRVAQTYLHPESALLVIVANVQEMGLE